MANDDGTTGDPTPEGDENGVVSALRETNQRNEQRANAAERKLAVIEAGVDPNFLGTKPGQAFVDNLSGDLDAEGILNEAKEWGYNPEASSEGDGAPTLTEEERRAQDLRGGGAPPPPPPAEPQKDVWDEGYEEYFASLKAGDRRRDAFRKGITPAVVAAAEDREDAPVWTGWSEEELEGA